MTHICYQAEGNTAHDHLQCPDDAHGAHHCPNVQCNHDDQRLFLTDVRLFFQQLPGELLRFVLGVILQGQIHTECGSAGPLLYYHPITVSSYNVGNY